MNELMEMMLNTSGKIITIVIAIIIFAKMAKITRFFLVYLDGLLLGIGSAFYLYSMIKPDTVFRGSENYEEELIGAYKVIYTLVSPLRDNEYVNIICTAVFLIIPVMVFILVRKYIRQRHFIDLIVSGFLALEASGFVYAAELSWGSMDFGKSKLYGFLTGLLVFAYRFIQNIYMQKLLRDDLIYLGEDVSNLSFFLLRNKNKKKRYHKSYKYTNNKTRDKGIFKRRKTEDNNTETNNSYNNNENENKSFNSFSKENTFSFFAGCDSKEAVEKRYKQLAKTYHPDNQDGDTKAFQIINEAYKKAKTAY